jgi:TolB-like protein
MKQLKLFLSLLLGLFLIASSIGISASEVVNGFNEGAKILSDLISEQFMPLKGYVIGVKGNEVYINLGAKDRVQEEQVFEVVRPGEQLLDPISGEVLGFFEEPVGMIKIHTIREAISIGTINESIITPQNGDCVFLKTEKKQVYLGVMPFTMLNGNSLTKAQLFAERLSTTLATKPHLRIAERNQLNEALAELKFGLSGLVDTSTAQQIGEFLGVDALVIGTMAETGTVVSISMRVVDVKTGLVLAGHSIDVTGDTLGGVNIERPMNVGDFSGSPTNYGTNESSLFGNQMSSVFNVTFRQKLAERFHCIAIGNLQGDDVSNLVGLNWNFNKLKIYRYSNQYKKIWDL